MDVQGLDYVKAKDAPLPLVGLPIGAGPEAAGHMGHIGSFQDCVLHQRNKAKQSQQAPTTQGTTKPQEAAHFQQAIEAGQTGDNGDCLIVGGLLAAANDTPDSRLVRLTHRKSASA